jgi:hypothetical protein
VGRTLRAAALSQNPEICSNRPSEQVMLLPQAELAHPTAMEQATIRRNLVLSFFGEVE